METITERSAIPIVLMWRDAKLNRAATAESTKKSIRDKCNAILKLLETDNPVDEETVRKILYSSRQYSYTHRLAAMLISICKWASEHGMMSMCPLHKVKLPRPRFDHRKYFLSREELIQIRDTPLDGKLARLRDIFLLQCYSGLAYADVQSIRPLDRYAIAGREWLRIVRKKTKTQATIPITPEILEILDRYGWSIQLPCNQTYNEELKEIGRAAGIERPLHSHLACKTFVQGYLDKGMQVESTAKMRGITAKTLIEHYGSLSEYTLSVELAQRGL